MIARIERVHDRLSAGLDRMLGELGGMTAPQRRFKPDESTWSATEVCHHVFLAQSGIVDELEKMRGRKAIGRSLSQSLWHQVVRLVLWSGIKVKNPAPSAAPDASVTLDELEPRWASERNRLRGLLEGLDESALGDAGFKHPIAGPLSLEETVTFLATHVEHHLRQLRRIRSHPDFPS